MKKDLLKVSIRQHAIYLPAIEGTEKREAFFDYCNIGCSTSKSGI